MRVDEIDRKILRQMQADPDLPMSALANRAGLTSSACARRLEKMREAGIYRGQQAVINWAALGYNVEVYLRVTLDKTQPRAFDDFIEEARKIPEVSEVHTFLGRVDVRLAVLARDMAHYQEIYKTRILTLPHITDIEALMRVSSIKDTEILPV
ncbi:MULTISPECIES: Lrp/AsnC family transcriptional regulator [Halocynthiibacter]|uniref:Lrp/AsnC family transcriptional regulator n=1 Tax=Halocynthiibacter halioticoli TaxID=2986804 RepID=A0AAE3LUE5_9RHOB|nr:MULTISPECIES: Lrp/AsnC family transcriptional regulator [Halocynthiibacter]MCV6823875.1 Lrp/AsnC family transcriptional regulator [Halocynthiibacter halioticoli]MCW4056876.1 Lrp/AsnC family transcriptional regulator [Halocynthiibacter sp. SDUM655004]MDE0590106.1 Lrp/AsnC family transcriptional regulator [Halocynthiibacter sp. C4]